MYMLGVRVHKMVVHSGVLHIYGMPGKSACVCQ